MASDPRSPVPADVRADDPQLSPEANRLLTEELREAIGTDKVQLPRERAETAGTIHDAGRSRLVALLASNRLLLLITFVALVVVGVIVSLTTGSWWAVVAAAAVHALGTIVIGSVTIRMSTQVEHVHPSVAARLADEGVPDPDAALSDLVTQYAGDGEARGAAEVVSTGHNDVTVRPDEDPARAAAEQRSALTPAGSPVGPAGRTGAPAVLPIVAVAGSLVVGLAAAIAVGGIAWLGAAMLVGVSVAWLLLMRHMDGRGEERDGGEPSGPARSMKDAEKGRRSRLLPTAVLVVGAVVAGVILVGAMAGYL
jgi:hypothetical protein